MSKGDYKTKSLHYRLGDEQSILDKHSCCADTLVYNVYLYRVVDKQGTHSSWVRCNRAKRAGFLTCWYHDPLEDEAQLCLKGLGNNE